MPKVLPPLRRRALRHGLPDGASYKREEDGIVLVNETDCIGCGLCAWACPYGAREMDPAEKVMKKCTLCVDRIYNENLPEEDRQPACVRTCPAGARHFGDLSDPESDVSQLVAERGGMDLMPEQGTKPVNKYLPPRPRDAARSSTSLPPILNPSRKKPPASSAGSTARFRRCPDASRSVYHHLHHLVGPRLRNAGLSRLQLQRPHRLGRLLVLPHRLRPSRSAAFCPQPSTSATPNAR